METGHTQIGNQVTEIVTDYGGYWRSGITNINPVLPNNSHNLLAFTYDSVRYSTGVNDALLTSNGLPFTARKFNAIAVSAVPGTLSTNTKMGLGALYDGVNNGASTPPPSAALSYYLMDGPQGLNLGTGVANLPVGVLRFDVTNLQAGSIGNGIPDILITQFANPSAATDKYSFRNAAGQIVGNEVSISLTALNVLGNWTADFYETTPTRTLQTAFRQTNRPLRMWAADLSVFGLDATNIGSVTGFQIQLSGESDQAFVAYNTSALGLAPDELPGGVSKQPSLWLKANNGPNTMTDAVAVSDWADKSGKANNASQSSVSLRPVFRLQGSNFNPTVNFAAQYLNTFQNLTVGDGQPYTSFVVMQNLAPTVAKNVLGSTGNFASVRQSLSAGNLPSVLHGANTVLGSTTAFGTSTRIWSTLYSGTANRLLLDQAVQQTGTTAGTFVNRPSQIGSHQGAVPAGNVNIAEVITYPMALSDNEIQRINSYLAIKYGITLSTNYLSCGSGLLFESDGPGTTFLYDNRITGIGRENCQLLNQKQSRSIVPGSMITMAAGDSIRATNADNTSLIPDGAYLLFGDNNGAVSWGSGTVGGFIESRIARTWKAVATNSAGAVKIRVPASSSTETVKLQSLPPLAVPFMLVKSDDNFMSGYTTVPLTLSNTNFETSYTFGPGTHYFTFGYRIVDPLPVSLVSFEAVADEEKYTVDLAWATASETNNDFFTIEKSVDGITWETLDRYPGAGNSNTPRSYTATDEQPAEGFSYYRLRQTDFDGGENLEGIRSVYLSPRFRFSLYPNPADDAVHIRGEGIDRVEVYDVSGKLCHTEYTASGTGCTVATDRFAEGTYYFKVITGDRSQVRKVVIGHAH